MFPDKALLSLLFISLAAVDASPLSRSTGKATLSFATSINETGTLNIAERDRARAHALKSNGHLDKRAGSISTKNIGMAYTVKVGIGSPATDYTLLVDTGSSNTWIGVSKAYIKTKTSKNTGNNVSVTYGSGSFFGEEWIDTVDLGSGLVIENQSIGVASFTSGFNGLGVDGILGIGPVDETSHTVSHTGTVPTVPDNLRSQGKISEEVLGIYFVPDSESTSTGEITFGGYDQSVITSPVKYVPITSATESKDYWGVDQTISYGGSTILSKTAGVVDTGTTLILIATDAFQKYQSATGGTLDSTTGLLTVTSSQYSKLKALSFDIGGTTYELSPNAQIWPRSLNHVIGGKSGLIYLVVADIGTLSGSGIDFIDGYSFLERYYSVFDTTHHRVGFATTKYTKATIN